MLAFSIDYYGIFFGATQSVELFCTYEKSNVNDLVTKLQNACDKKEMVWKFKHEAADFICGKYNWDDVVKKTMELYRGDK